MFCPNCGIEQLKGTTFCSNCGAELPNIPESSKNITTLPTPNDLPSVNLNKAQFIPNQMPMGMQQMQYPNQMMNPNIGMQQMQYPNQMMNPNMGMQQMPKQQININITNQHNEPKQTNKNKYLAAGLAVFLGGLGAHKFYLGKYGWGIVYALFMFFSFLIAMTVDSPELGLLSTLPCFVSYVEAIMYLCMSNEDFQKKY